MKTFRSKIIPLHNKPVDIAAARNKQRKDDNQMIIDRIKGIPATPATLESDSDPQNPNAK